MNNKTISKYDKYLYNTRPISVSNYISGLPDAIHSELYSDAIRKFCEANSIDDLSRFQVIEKKSPYFWQPSYIKLIDRNRHPYVASTYWLGDFWNSEYMSKAANDYSYMNVGAPNLTMTEIDYLNYVKGTATFRSKYTGDTFKAGFEQVGDETEVSNGFDVYNRTFSYLVEQNKQSIL